MISVGIFIILYFIGNYGDLALAGYGTAIRYEQLFLLPVLGLNTAVLSMVGQNFGAKKIKRINEIYNKALIYGCGFMLLSSVVIFFSSEIAIKLFTDNSNVIKYGSKYLQITALMTPIYPIFFISNALIQGLKKANIVMLLTVIRMVILPLVFLYYLVIYLQANFETAFFGLVIINWISGIIIFLLTKFIIQKEKNKVTIKQSV